MRARSQHARTSAACARTVAATSFGLTEPGAADSPAEGVEVGAKEEALAVAWAAGAVAATGATTGGVAGVSGCAKAIGAEGASCVSLPVSVSDERDFLLRPLKCRPIDRGVAGL